MTAPSDTPGLRARASHELMRAGRALFRNTPLQKFPGVSAVYGRLVKSAYGGDGTTVVTFRGAEIEITAGDITTLPTLADGTYESAELDRFLARVRSGSVVADIGANIGVWAVLLSRAVGADGRVVAFEPSPENAALLRSNLARNGCTNVDIVPAAVGRATGSGSLDTTTPGATHRLAADASAGDTAVDVVSLDDYAAAHGVRFAAVKIDIEGFEPEAFAGMGAVLATCGLVLTEFSNPQAEAVGLSWGAALDALLARFGSAEVFDGRGTEVLRPGATAEILASKKLLNLLFVDGDAAGS